MQGLTLPEKFSAVRKITIFICLFIIGICLFSENAFGGAWTVPQFKLWTEFYMKYSWSYQDFNEKGDLTDKKYDAKSWSWEIEPKFELGVTDWMTLLFSFTGIESHYKEYTRPVEFGPYSVMNNGVKNITYGTRLRVLKAPVVTSLQFKIFQYTGYDNPYGIDSVEGQPMVGRGDDAFEIKALFGKTFDIEIPVSQFDWKYPAYIGVETGYRWRNRDVANDIPLFIEAGYWPYKWLLLKGELDAYKAHAGTGIAQSYAVWRIGAVFQIFGMSQFRDTNLFNIEVQYGKTFWGKGGSSDPEIYGSLVNAGHEVVLKIQYQF